MDTNLSLTYTIEKKPVQITLLRGGDALIRLKTPFEFLNMMPTKDGLQIECSQAALELTQEDNRFVFKWMGEEIINQISLTGRWYGIGELVNQHWILNEVMLPLHDFLTVDAGATGLSNLMTPAFINDQGVMLLVHSPVKIGVNQPPVVPGKVQNFVLGEEIPFEQRPRRDHKGEGDGNLSLAGVDLHFEVVITENVVNAQRELVKKVGQPRKTPPISLFGAPVWTTWAQYKDVIDQEIVLEFAAQIKANRFPYQAIEIDDRWQSQYGELSFDSERFPDPKGMITELHEMDFKVTAWVIPFLHTRSFGGQEAAERGFVVKMKGGSPYPARWWHGKAYLLDATNPRAMAWFGERLTSLQKATGLDGFKFDGGEAMYVPTDAVLYKSGASRNQYSHDYVEWVAKNFSFCEVRTGWMNQTAPILFRLWDLWSTWSHANGLRAIIPATLSLSLTGYPFTFPDMIGGNGYLTFPKSVILNRLITRVILPLMERAKKKSLGDEDVAVHASDVPPFIQHQPAFGWPTSELMIRWTQLNALLPVMQFSITPWQFGEECTEICRAYAKMHEEFTPLFQELALRAARTGEPIVRPVFWLAPNDPKALACDDQFLIGDHLLVAPVVHKGGRKRDIYLPPGEWIDHWTGVTLQGSRTIVDYPVPLNVLPFFTLAG